MRFNISRTSSMYWEKPCEGAIDISESEDDNHWVIDINTLDELMEFINIDNKTLVIGAKYLEIYDDYRE